MSTKSTLKYSDGRFHLYVDTLDMLDDEPQPVYLDLTNMDFEAYRWGTSGGVVIKIDRNVAQELGLIPRDTENVKGSPDK